MANLDASINNIELKTNKTASSALPLNTYDASQYPDALSVKNLNNNFMNEIYPIGSLYKTTSSTFDPSVAGWSGTWSLVESGYITRHISSQVIHPGLSGSGQVAKTKAIGCYDRNLFADMYNKPEFQKTGFHPEIRVSAMISTGGQNFVTLYLNNITLGSDNTWSNDIYRVPILSSNYRPENIALDTVIGYTKDGINLCYAVTNSSGTNTDRWAFWDVCLHAYLVSDDCIYTWKRTA